MTDAAAAILAEVDRLGGTLVLLRDGTPALRAPKDPAKRRALEALAPLLSEWRETILSSLPGAEVPEFQSSRVPESEPEPVVCRTCGCLWWAEPAEIAERVSVPGWCDNGPCPWRQRRPWRE